MLIIGTTQIVRKRGTGDFLCPACGAETAFRRKSVQTFLTLYFIPVLPTGKRREFVECTNCSEAFDPRVLTMPRSELEQVVEAAAADYVANAMLVALAAQPNTSPRAIETFRSIYERLSGEVVSAEDVEEHLAMARAQRVGMSQVLGPVARSLDEIWASRLVQAVFLVANADDAPSPAQLQLLAELPGLLGMPEEEFRARVAEASELGEEVFH